MKATRILITTDDGSSTILDAETGDHFHSTHGAEQEAQHVFIDAGLKKCLEEKNELHLLEVGLGTGLNLMLTFDHALNHPKLSIHYTGIEPFPVEKSLYTALSFKALKNPDMHEIFLRIHEAETDGEIQLSPSFLFEKKKVKLNDFSSTKHYDLIYYDAFGPAFQPDMWELKTIEHVYSLMKPNAYLVTYCAKGEFRRMLESLGLTVERLAGPPGKREMIRARRT